MVQKVNESKSKDVSAAVSRVETLEGALVAALDDIENASMDGVQLLGAQTAEIADMRANLASSQSQLGSLTEALSEAREKLRTASAAAEKAQVRGHERGSICTGWVGAGGGVASWHGCWTRVDDRAERFWCWMQSCGQLQVYRSLVPRGHLRMMALA